MATSQSSGMTGRLTRRVGDFIHENRLCQPGDRVLVACSGGPDSTALLDILHKLAPELGVSLGVLHVDHGQQPGSGRVQKKVRERSRRLGLDFQASQISPKSLPPGSSEATMRKARLAVFEEVAEARGYDRVATGHTGSDQVETVLMRVLRGTTTAGLAGIPVMRGRLIRPLLCCSGPELMAYLKSRRLSSHDDPANRDRRHLRNRIRHDVLPRIRKLVNPAVDTAVLRLSRSASRDQHLLSGMARGVRPRTVARDCLELPVSRLDNLHDAVLSRVLVQMLQTLGGPGMNLEQHHLDRILAGIRLSDSRPQFALDLPGGIQAYLKQKQFGLRRRTPSPQAGFHLTVEGPANIVLPLDGTRLRFALQPDFHPDMASRRQVFFDARRVPFPLVVRSVAPGDRLRPWGMEGSRKVARMLLDAKIPRHLRPRVPLLVWRERVLWVAGLRRSDWAPVREGCHQVLSVEWLDDSPSV